MEQQDRVAIVQQFGRTYRAFMSAFEGQVGHPMPRWRVMLALHDQGGESSQIGRASCRERVCSTV